MGRPRIEAVLFDKDGTLIDFKKTWMGAYRGVAAELAERVGRPPVFAIELLAKLGYHDEQDRFDDKSPLLWATNPMVRTEWTLLTWAIRQRARAGRFASSTAEAHRAG